MCILLLKIYFLAIVFETIYNIAFIIQRIMFLWTVAKNNSCLFPCRYTG